MTVKAVVFVEAVFVTMIELTTFPASFLVFTCHDPMPILQTREIFRDGESILMD